MISALLKSTAGILMLAIPVYAIAVAMLTSVLIRARGSDSVRSTVLALAQAMAMFHAMPLLVLLVMLFSGYWWSNDGFGIDAALALLFAHGLVGAVILASACLVVLIPIQMWFRHYRRSTGSGLPSDSARRVTVFICTVFAVLSSGYEKTVVRGLTELVCEERTVVRTVAGGRDFSIALISDTQVDAYTGRERMCAAMADVRRASPDLLLFAGDIASATVDMKYPTLAIECLASVRAPAGIYVVMGDHDLWSSWRRVDSVYRHYNVPRLLNDVARVDRDGVSIDILGLTNVQNDPADERRLDTLLAKRRRGAYAILLVHQLSDALAEQASRAGVNLIVAGHTHGGQIALPMLGTVLRWLGVSSRYESGWYSAGETAVYVSNGIGYSVIPLRVFAVPSFGMLHLRQ
jgi:uncharacterized protein